MKKVLVLSGPTASGKTAISIQLAKAFNGEIISGDSQQVYRQLNIGTAKITPHEMDGIPHHGLDLVDYDQAYSVKDFQEMARNAIDEISSRGKLPILVGGTGFYLKAALYDYVFENEIESNPIDDQGTDEELHARLTQIDPISALKIHPNNRKRVLRALQIASHGQLKSVIEEAQTHQPMYDAFMMVLSLPKAELDQRIASRVDLMFEQGLKSEVLDTFKTPESWKYLSFQGIGYKEWLPYLKGESNLEDVMEQIVIHTRQFAKRQMTWFRHQFNSRFVDPRDQNELNTCLEEIKTWLKEEK
jgi:tRNA dimethylallyltransferase